MRERWSADQAWAWYRAQPWLVGCNFIPSTAINQLEMWQAASYDPVTIERELGWARQLGFNTVRVYLHDLLWQQDAVGFKNRIDHFLNLCAAQGIRPLFVFFDDCWNTEFSLGPQPGPRPSVHNSGWVQSPGARLVDDPASWGRLADYVSDVLTAFGRDERVLAWDLYNEPGNQELGLRSLGLLTAVFAWAHRAAPQQPITVGVWHHELPELSNFQLENSDIVSFHNYSDGDHLERQIVALKIHGRPLLCTEYLSRPQGSRFQTHLPIFQREQIGCFNWGLVSGKTQTIWPWRTPEGAPEPEEWFHDIFHDDGRPHRPAEVAFIKSLLVAQGDVTHG